MLIRNDCAECNPAVSDSASRLNVCAPAVVHTAVQRRCPKYLARLVRSAGCSQAVPSATAVNFKAKSWVDVAVWCLPLPCRIYSLQPASAYGTAIISPAAGGAHHGSEFRLRTPHFSFPTLCLRRAAYTCSLLAKGTSTQNRSYVVDERNVPLTVNSPHVDNL